jgi:NTP pyrophosphatase (non-canonical NTP hydrolase)
MQFQELVNKAVEVRNVYEQYEKNTFGKTWSKENFAEGLVGDIGDLMKLIMAKEGIREIENVDEKLAHELSDCLWSIIMLAKLYNVNLEESFVKNMDTMKTYIEKKLIK